MNVKEIVTEYLKAHGFDGLCDPDHECGCEAGDFPCDFCNGGCVPAMKKEVTAEDIPEEGAEYQIGDEIFIEAAQSVPERVAPCGDRRDCAECINLADCCPKERRHKEK